MSGGNSNDTLTTVIRVHNTRIRRGQRVIPDDFFFHTSAPSEKRNWPRLNFTPASESLGCFTYVVCIRERTRICVETRDTGYYIIIIYKLDNIIRRVLYGRRDRPPECRLILTGCTPFHVFTPATRTIEKII